MIVGHGDIAGALIDHEDFLFFASGVSNSACRDQDEFDREWNLLLKQPRGKHLVYFSSLCIYTSATPYAMHKYHIEQLIGRTFDAYTIIRLGNITWGSNPNTLVNFLRSRIKNRYPYEVQPVCRCLVDKEELLEVVERVIEEKPKEVNVMGRRLSVAQIVRDLKRGAL